jgi:hypothetical protein
MSIQAADGVRYVYLLVLLALPAKPSKGRLAASKGPLGVFMVCLLLRSGERQ